MFISPIKSWRRQKKVKKLLGKVGKITTWTKIHVASEEFKKFAPYVVTLVEFADGTKSFGELVDFDQKHLKIGTKVKSVLRIIGESTAEGVVNYGLKFRPIGLAISTTKPSSLTPNMPDTPSN